MLVATGSFATPYYIVYSLPVSGCAFVEFYFCHFLTCFTAVSMPDPQDILRGFKLYPVTCGLLIFTQWLCPRKSGTFFTSKRYVPKIFGYRCTWFDYVPDCYYVNSTCYLYLWPLKPHFSSRIPIACQLYEHANKLLQKSFEGAQRPSPVLYLVWQCYAYSQYKTIYNLVRGVQCS